jgi:ABC-2 type transport system permease protein
MNIYRREIQVNLKSLLIWTTALAGMGVLVMAFFPTIARQAETLERLVAGLPPGLLAAFGLQNLSMTDILGYYASKHYLMVTLFGSIYAILLASGIISKEESDRTIEFLLSKPIKRSAIVNYKCLSLLTLILVFNIALSIIMFITLQIVKVEDFNIYTYLLLCIAPLLMHLTFAALGLLVSVLTRKTSTIMPLALGIVLATYFLSIAAALSEKLEFLKYFSPFKYVDAIDIVTNQRIEPQYLLLMLLINIIAIYCTFRIYTRKDILV